MQVKAKSNLISQSNNNYVICTIIIDLVNAALVTY
jgi:hypothetical protein